MAAIGVSGARQIPTSHPPCLISPASARAASRLAQDSNWKVNPLEQPSARSVATTAAGSLHLCANQTVSRCTGVASMAWRS